MRHQRGALPLPYHVLRRCLQGHIISLNSPGKGTADKISPGNVVNASFGETHTLILDAEGSVWARGDGTSCAESLALLRSQIQVKAASLDSGQLGALMMHATNGSRSKCSAIDMLYRSVVDPVIRQRSHLSVMFIHGVGASKVKPGMLR